jgi:integrase
MSWHTAGSLMLQAGKTMTTVSKILGHSSVGVTEKIYAHAYDDDKRDAVSSVSQRLRQVGGNE